jgi:hypothetical protein
MQYTTSFDIKSAANPMEPGSNVLTMGSCFADAIGQKLLQNKLNCQVNPFGTTYNPVSIAQLLHTCMVGGGLNPQLIVEREGLYLHHDLHSGFSANSPQKLHDIAAELFITQASKLQSCNYILITLGTAYVYKHNNTGLMVNNCQKVAQSMFSKELLHVKQICQELGSLYHKLQSYSPGIELVLTVSPVRHIKDGLAQNQLSKSILRTACHYLEKDFEHISYFPAYEIMIDELRDYRWYAPDLLHPNQQAQDYIFERFAKAYFSDKLKEILALWQPLRLELLHRPFNENSAEHQKFLGKLKLKLEKLSCHIDVSGELAEVESRIFAAN